MAESEGKSAIGPVTRFLRFFVIAMTLVVIGQLWLNPPARRPYVACWPVYQVGRFFSVTTIKALFYNEPVFALQNAMRMEHFYDGCVSFTSKIPGFGGTAPAQSQPAAKGPAKQKDMTK